MKAAILSALCQRRNEQLERTVIRRQVRAAAHLQP
jgi:hypothetical protein